MNINLTSPAFDDGDFLPVKYTCDGANISPPLKWDSLPPKTESIAIICEDPDAPSGNWTHWIIFNIPPQTTSLPENIPDDETLTDGTRQGINDFGATGYGGPCPPWGTHRYFFKIYALDIIIDIVSFVDKDTFLNAITGHILATGRLMGKYKRK